jgi:hypothetical protein
MSNEQKQEIMTTVTLNKIATVITSNNGFGSVKSMDKKSFYSIASTFQQLEVVVSSGINNAIKALKNAGFNVEVDNSWGFEWECKLICTK